MCGDGLCGEGVWREGVCGKEVYSRRFGLHLTPVSQQRQPGCGSPWTGMMMVRLQRSWGCTSTPISSHLGPQTLAPCPPPQVLLQQGDQPVHLHSARQVPVPQAQFHGRHARQAAARRVLPPHPPGLSRLWGVTAARGGHPAGGGGAAVGRGGAADGCGRAAGGGGDAQCCGCSGGVASGGQ